MTSPSELVAPSEIAADVVVGIQYTLRGEDREILDASEKDSPLLYIHGYGQIIPGLERALTGKKVGDKVSVTVEPSDAYGEYDAELKIQATKEQFPPNAPLEVGAVFELVGGNEETIPARIVAVEGANITLDANHPLAGKKLSFEVEIETLRSATKEELEHGHAHGVDGHSGHHH